MNHLEHRRVLVLGLGASGLAMARWCARFGADVQVWDSREEPPQAAALATDAPQAVLHCGPAFMQDPVQAMAGVQLVLKSPGLAPNDERIAPLLSHARQTGVAVQGELELFARALADLKAERQYDPDVLAITGTNGKTTTTSLTARLIERTGRRVAMAGNIGPTMLDTLAAALDLEPVIVSDFGQLDESAADERSLPVESASARAVVDIDADGDGPTVLEEHGVVEQALAAGAEPPDAAEAPMPQDGSESALGERQESGDEVAHVEPAADDAAPSSEASTEVDAEGAAASDMTAAPDDDGFDPNRPLPIALPPPPGPVFEHLPEVWVLELSSFQLDDAVSFQPTAAVVLNVTQDHLDWHGTMEAYAASKARIYGQGENRQTIMVLNRDDERVMAMNQAPTADPSDGKPGSAKAAKAQARRIAAHAARRVVRFGLSDPQYPGDFGVSVQNGMAWLVRAMEADPTIKRRPGAPVEDLSVQRLMPADALRIRGRHNWSNALAALALATAIGCPLAPMLHGLREYEGEPHRVQFVANVHGVDAFDDSKGTNVGATVAALVGLGGDRAPAKLAVILGGDGKGQDFSPLIAPVLRHARAVATIGQDAQAIEDVLRAALPPEVALQRHDTLEAATRWSFGQARPGDAVLLSPACASLDMFKNYAHRAQVFIAEVESMVNE